MHSDETDRQRKRVLLLVATVSATVCLLAVLSPVSGQAWIHPLLGSACHQDSDRCLSIAGEPMALCARCLAIFLGLSFGSFIALGLRFSRGVALMLLVLAASLTALDVGAEALGLYTNLIPVRLMTGFFLGLTAAWMIGHRAEPTSTPLATPQQT